MFESCRLSTLRIIIVNLRKVNHDIENAVLTERHVNSSTMIIFRFFEVQMSYLKGFAISGMVIVLNHHFPLDWWEGVLLSFGITILVL